MQRRSDSDLRKASRVRLWRAMPVVVAASWRGRRLEPPGSAEARLQTPTISEVTPAGRAVREAHRSSCCTGPSAPFVSLSEHPASSTDGMVVGRCAGRPALGPVRAKRSNPARSSALLPNGGRVRADQATGGTCCRYAGTPAQQQGRREAFFVPCRAPPPPATFGSTSLGMADGRPVCRHTDGNGPRLSLNGRCRIGLVGRAGLVVCRHTGSKCH